MNSEAPKLPDSIAANLFPYDEIVLDGALTQKIDGLDHSIESVSRLKDNLKVLASELPAELVANLTPNDILELCEAFPQKVESAHSLADDFANPHPIVKAMRKVSIVGQLLARKRMVKSAQALVESMPNYCKGMPLETHDDVQGLLTVADTLQRFDSVQRELLVGKKERNQLARLLLESLPGYCLALPAETHTDLQELLAIANVFQRYGAYQRELLDTTERFKQAAQSLLASLPNYCANLPVDTPGHARELVAVANTLQRYSAHQRELLNSVRQNWREPRLEILRARIENSQERAIEVSVKLVDVLMIRRLLRLTPDERRAIVRLCPTSSCLAQ